MTETITWVSVDDEFPNADLTVLTFDLNRDVQMGYYDSEEGWTHENATVLLGVTHWSELPKGPGPANSKQVTG